MFGITRTVRIKNLNLVENSMALIAQIAILRYEFPSPQYMLLVAFYPKKSP